MFQGYTGLWKLKLHSNTKAGHTWTNHSIRLLHDGICSQLDTIQKAQKLLARAESECLKVTDRNTEHM
jgi:hypothetical protein